MARKISIDNSIEKPLENTPLPQLTEKFIKESPECLKFISAEPEKDGPYGPYGKEVISYLNEKGEDSLFLQDDPSAMKNVCPLWGKLSQEKRKHLWVWFMASIAFDESRCIKSASNNEATNGVAIGLFQLDERPSMRSWRGQNCRTVTVKEPIDNIRCTMDIFEELLKGPKGTYKSNGELWGRGSNSYFQKLRRDQGGQIGTLFKSNPICSSQ